MKTYPGFKPQKKQTVGPWWLPDAVVYRPWVSWGVPFVLLPLCHILGFLSRHLAQWLDSILPYHGHRWCPYLAGCVGLGLSLLGTQQPPSTIGLPLIVVGLYLFSCVMKVATIMATFSLLVYAYIVWVVCTARDSVHLTTMLLHLAGVMFCVQLTCLALFMVD